MDLISLTYKKLLQTNKKKNYSIYIWIRNMNSFTKKYMYTHR